MSDPGEAVLTSAAPRFSDTDIIRLVTENFGAAGHVLRRMNSERDQVVMYGDDGRQLVVKFSNKSETATNIELEEAAALWAVAADPALPLSTPLAVIGTKARHLVVQHPETGESHFLRAYERATGGPVDRASLAWHQGVVCVRALVEVAGWVAAGTIEGRDGHPWVIAGDAFAARLHSLTSVEVTPR